MGLRTANQYKDALRQYNPNIYVAGKKQENVVDNECFQISLKEACKQFEWANHPETREEFTEWSDLIGEKVSFWTALRRTKEDLFKMAEVTKKYNGKEFCTFCQGAGPGTLYALTWEIDQARGTDYHRRYLEALKECQRHDTRGCIGVMDAKGDRSKLPSQQSDPDLYVRLVDKTREGIFVQGAKTHTSNAPVAEFVIVSPCGVLTEADKDYALAFMVPIDAPGLTFITRPAPGFLDYRPGPKTIENPVSSSIGFTESITVFDNVFIPWEHVFMCGEWEFTDNYIRYFSASARLSKLICTSSRTDIIAGAAALMAEYNGVARAGHIRNKLIDMMIASEIGWGCALGSIAKSTMHPSGVPVPDLSIANAGLYHCRLRLIEFLGMLQEIAGGLVTTMPLEADYRNEELRPLIDKYLQGKVGIKTENRLKLLYFINELTASRFCGYLISSALSAGGTPETNRLDVARSYNLGEKISNIKKWCSID
jgi:4-hydroxybutyryl-CoA dehydratase / vinylacetyl-CoA-Delta-isomerase